MLCVEPNTYPRAREGFKKIVKFAGYVNVNVTFEQKRYTCVMWSALICSTVGATDLGNVAVSLVMTSVVFQYKF